MADVPDISELDTAVHGPVRLGVLTALQVEGTVSFTNLKKRLRVALASMRKMRLTLTPGAIGPTPSSTPSVVPAPEARNAPLKGPGLPSSAFATGHPSWLKSAWAFVNLTFWASPLPSPRTRP